MTILNCYDGSADAGVAIDCAGLVMPGSEATPLVTCETILDDDSKWIAGLVAGAYDRPRPDPL